MADPGSYLLVVDCTHSTEIEVGALGPIQFETGYYAYAGSAFGPGGLSRVDRHRTIARGDHDVRHWHIDYLLGADGVELSTVELFPERDVECALAAAVKNEGCRRIESFGASDCDCGSHLWGPTSRSTLRAVVDSI